MPQAFVPNRAWLGNGFRAALIRTIACTIPSTYPEPRFHWQTLKAATHQHIAPVDQRRALLKAAAAVSRPRSCPSHKGSARCCRLPCHFASATRLASTTATEPPPQATRVINRPSPVRAPISALRPPTLRPTARRKSRRAPRGSIACDVPGAATPPNRQ